MKRNILKLMLPLALIAACGEDTGEIDPRGANTGGSSGATGGASGGDGGMICDDIELVAMELDPDEGFIDITDFCVAEMNMYRARDGLEPYTVKEDGRCCSAREAHQAWLDGTHHNNSYCDWVSQGAAGGGRNPTGTAKGSVEWVPRLFWQERGPTYEESGGHYQAMMRPETREIACGFYAADRDNHRVVVNYW